MSFVSLIDDRDWSDADITSNTEAMVRKHFPADAEVILNRKQWAVAIGQITDPAVIAAVQAEAAQFASVTLAAQQAGVVARETMRLKREAWRVERGELALEDAPADVQEAVALRAAARPQPEPEPPVDSEGGEA